jgi:hypothetical protein
MGDVYVARNAEPDRPPSAVLAAPPRRSSPSAPRPTSVSFSSSSSAPSVVTERRQFQLVNWSQNRGPLHTICADLQIAQRSHYATFLERLDRKHGYGRATNSGSKAARSEDAGIVKINRRYRKSIEDRMHDCETQISFLCNPRETIGERGAPLEHLMKLLILTLQRRRKVAGNAKVRADGGPSRFRPFGRAVKHRKAHMVHLIFWLPAT